MHEQAELDSCRRAELLAYPDRQRAARKSCIDLACRSICYMGGAITTSKMDTAPLGILLTTEITCRRKAKVLPVLQWFTFTVNGMLKTGVLPRDIDRYASLVNLSVVGRVKCLAELLVLINR